jgi:hypothetical protein
MRPEDARPPNWGTHNLARFLDAATGNTYATAYQHPAWYGCLTAVEREYDQIVCALDNSQSVIGAMFVLRAHAAYLGGTRLVLGTQVPEAYMVLRGCLESALYGLYLARHPDAAQRWLRRQDGPADRAASKRALQASTLSAYLAKVDSATHARYQRMYEGCIDRGAHPNTWALAGHMGVTESEDRHTFELQYLTTDPLQLEAVLKDAARIGVISLDVFRNLFRERFDLTGATARLDEIKQRYRL